METGSSGTPGLDTEGGSAAPARSSETVANLDFKVWMVDSRPLPVILTDIVETGKRLLALFDRDETKEMRRMIQILTDKICIDREYI